MINLYLIGTEIEGLKKKNHITMFLPAAMNVIKLQKVKLKICIFVILSVIISAIILKK